MLQPRLMKAKEAAAYCGLSVAGFKAFLKSQKINCKIHRTRLYDLAALDRALNRISGLENPAKSEAEIYYLEKARINKDAILPRRYKHGKDAA